MKLLLFIYCFLIIDGCVSARKLVQVDVVSFVKRIEDDAHQNVVVTRLFRERDNELDTGFGGISKVGTRFDQLDVPQGVKILSATFLIAGEDRTRDITQLEIFGERSPDTVSFSIANDIESRPPTNARIKWDVPPLQEGLVVETDVTEIVQEIVNLNDWQPNNSMVLILDPSLDPLADLPKFISFEGANRRAEETPTLKISFDLNVDDEEDEEDEDDDQENNNAIFLGAGIFGGATLVGAGIVQFLTKPEKERTMKNKEQDIEHIPEAIALGKSRENVPLSSRSVEFVFTQTSPQQISTITE